MAAFVAGVGVRSFVFMPYAAIWIAGIAVVAAFAIGARRKAPRTWIAGLCVAAFLLGIFRFDMVERDRPDLSGWYGKNVSAEGVVWTAPRRDGTLQRMKIKMLAIDGISLDERFFVLATVRRFPEYRIGDRVRLEGAMEKPENFSDFDYVSYLARDSVFVVMGFPRAEKMGEDTAWRLAVMLSRVKDAFEKNIGIALPEPHAAFMKGLLLGERASLPERITEDFRRAGVSHIVALSGYNITLVGRSLMNGLLRFTLPFLVSFWISIVAIVLFVLMTGAAASVVRAGIMGLLVLVAQKEGRAYQMANALAFAGAVMIFQNPYILRFDAGFQLSFLATIGLVYLSPHVERLVERVRFKLNFSAQKLRMIPKLSFSDSKLSLGRTQKRNAGYAESLGLKKIFVETLSAQIMVLPLLVWLFGAVSLVSPAANLAVLIAVPYAMGAGFVAAMLGFISPLFASVAGWGAWLLLEYKLRAISFFARVPFASVHIGAWTAAPMLIIYGVVFWQLWKKQQNTRV